MNPTPIQFQRAEAIAHLVLTESGLATVTREPTQSPIDLTAYLLKNGKITTWAIAIQLKAVTKDPRRQYAPTFSVREKRAVEAALTPVLLLVVNARTEKVFGAWTKRPVVPGPLLEPLYRTGQSINLVSITPTRLASFYNEAQMYYQELAANLKPPIRAEAPSRTNIAGMVISPAELNGIGADIIRMVATKLALPDRDWLSIPELLQVIDKTDSKGRALLGFHLSALKHWYDFHVSIARVGKAGLLSPSEVDQLNALTRAKDHSRKLLADHFRK